MMPALCPSVIRARPFAFAYSKANRTIRRVPATEIGFTVTPASGRISSPASVRSSSRRASAWGDPALLRQVWTNLLANAVKFTQHRTVGHVEVGGMVEDANSHYYVTDDGAGFDPAYVHKLFGVFQRLHGVEEFEGTGIGLAIVKRIVTRHGGSVAAEGKVGEGATFRFTLPHKES